MVSRILLWSLFRSRLACPCLESAARVVSGGNSIDKAMEITGNAAPQTRAGVWRPSATILYESGLAGDAVIPLANVLVRANTFFNSGQAYTDSNGNVTIAKGWGGKFRNPTKYIIIWARKNQWKIHDNAGKAKHKGPKQRAHWDFTISGDGDSKTAICATIHRALDTYYNQQVERAAGLEKYTAINVREHHGAHETEGLSYVHGRFYWSFMRTNEIHIWGRTYKALPLNNILATMFHELGHASHYTYAGGTGSYENADSQLRETWANGVGYAYTSSLYPDHYMRFINDYTHTRTGVIESLMWQGLTLRQIQTIFLNKSNLEQCRQPVKALGIVSAEVVDQIFDNPSEAVRRNLAGGEAGRSNPDEPYSNSDDDPAGRTDIEVWQ